MIRDTAIVLAAFVLGTVVAELAGAANLGTALGVGQLVFAIVLVWVLIVPGRAERQAGDTGTGGGRP
jgi:uncharacterized membrane protein (DUF485 family)